jgi:hypothetical protein
MKPDNDVTRYSKKKFLTLVYFLFDKRQCEGQLFFVFLFQSLHAVILLVKQWIGITGMRTKCNEIIDTWLTSTEFSPP